MRPSSVMFNILIFFLDSDISAGTCVYTACINMFLQVLQAVFLRADSWLRQCIQASVSTLSLICLYSYYTVIFFRDL